MRLVLILILLLSSEAGTEKETLRPETIPLQHAKAEELVRLFGGAVVGEEAKLMPATGVFTRLIPEGLQRPILAHRERNELLVTGTPEALETFRTVISLLDRPRPKEEPPPVETRPSGLKVAAILLHYLRASEVARMLGGRAWEPTELPAAPEEAPTPSERPARPLIPSAAEGTLPVSALLLPEGIVPPVLGCDLLNAVIATGTPEALANLRELIALFDQPPRQIEIAVHLLTANPEAIGQTRLPWTSSRGPSPGSPPGLRYVMGGDVWEQLQILRRRGQVNILDAPVIVTQNCQPTTLSIGQEILTRKKAEGAASEGSDRPHSLFVGQSLYLVPRITGAPLRESVTLLLAVTLRRLAGEVKGPEGKPLPRLDQRSFTTTVRVPKGHSVLFGGFRLSSGKGVENERRRTAAGQEEELFVLVTPRIVEGEE